MWKTTQRIRWAAGALVLGLLVSACSSSSSSTTSGGTSGASGSGLTGAGATFPAPMYQLWAQSFLQQQPDAKINY